MIMDHTNFCELILPFLKVETSIAEYDVLCKVNKFFNKELKTEHNIKLIEGWFRDKSADFFKTHCIYYLNSERINSSVHFTIMTTHPYSSDEEVHKGILSFNDDSTISMCITFEVNKDDEIVSRTFSNIKSLDRMKSIILITFYRIRKEMLKRILNLIYNQENLY